MIEGSIVTFYSYKGGVGRTFALASIGAALAQWGYQVLCIDWDLEAPGLHLYFEPWLTNKPHQGLLELIETYIAGGPCNGRTLWRQPNFPMEQSPYPFIPAGSLDASFVGRMQRLEWAELYQSHNLGQFFGRFTKPVETRV